MVLCLIIPQFALIFSPFDLSMAVLCEMSSLCLKRPYSYTWTNVLSISMTSLRSILYWLCLYTSTPVVYRIYSILCAVYPRFVLHLWFFTAARGQGRCLLEVWNSNKCPLGSKTCHVAFPCKFTCRGKASVAQKGGNLRVSKLKRSLSEEEKASLDTFAVIICWACRFHTTKPWQNNFNMF